MIINVSKDKVQISVVHGVISSSFLFSIWTLADTSERKYHLISMTVN